LDAAEFRDVIFTHWRRIVDPINYIVPLESFSIDRDEQKIRETEPVVDS